MEVAIINAFPSKVTELYNFNVEINALDANDLFDVYERLTRGRSGQREIKTNIKTDDISVISTLPGCPWGSTDREEPIRK